MFNAILFNVVFLWLLALTVRQANVSYWLKIWQDERNKVLNFIEEAKASWTKNSQQEKEQ